MTGSCYCAICTIVDCHLANCTIANCYFAIFTIAYYYFGNCPTVNFYLGNLTIVNFYLANSMITSCYLVNRTIRYFYLASWTVGGQYRGNCIIEILIFQIAQQETVANVGNVFQIEQQEFAMFETAEQEKTIVANCLILYLCVGLLTVHLRIFISPCWRNLFSSF